MGSNRARAASRVLVGGLFVALLASATRAEDDAERAIDEANELARQHKEVEAICKLERFLADAPTDRHATRVRLRLASLYHERRRPECAQKLEVLLRDLVAADEDGAASESWELLNFKDCEFRIEVSPGRMSEAPSVTIRSKGLRPDEKVPFEVWKIDATKVRAAFAKGREDTRVIRPFEQSPEAIESFLATPPPDALTKISTFDVAFVSTEAHVALPAAQEAGVYRIVARPRGIPVHRVLSRANHVIVLKRVDTHVLAFAVDRESGSPISNLQLESSGVFNIDKTQTHGSLDDERRQLALEEGKTRTRLALGKVGKDGCWSGDAPRYRTVFAWHDGAINGAPDSVFENPGAERRALYVTTDRPVYRPGHVVHWKAILRFRSETGEYRALPPGTELGFVVREPKGGELWKGVLASNAYGTYSGEIRLSRECSLGAYSIESGTGNNPRVGAFRVEEYRKPEYAVTVEPLSLGTPSVVVQGEVLKARVSGRYFFGQPVLSAHVRWQLQRRPCWRDTWSDECDEEDFRAEAVMEGGGEVVGEGDRELGADGTLSLEVPIERKTEKPETPEDLLTLTAKVVDASGREEMGSCQVVSPRASFSLSMSTDQLLYSSGTTAIVRVTALGLDSLPRAGITVSVTARPRSWVSEDGWVPSSRLIAEAEARTDATGTATLQLPTQAGGPLEIAARAVDEAGRETSVAEGVWIDGPELASNITEFVPVLPEKRVYAPGERAKIVALMPNDEGTALVTKERENVTWHEVVHFRGGQLRLEVPIQEADAPGTSLSVVSVSRGSRIQGSRYLRVTPGGRLLDLDVMFDKASYRPGEPAVLTVRAKEKATGKSVRCELAVGLVDAALYSLATEPVRDIAAYFYGKRKYRVATRTGLSWDADCEPLTFTFGGDDEKVELLGFADEGRKLAPVSTRKEFPDTWAYSSQLETDEQGVARIELKVPDTLTTWRATVRAVTVDTKVGQATKEATVSLPLVVRVEPPRFLVQGDKGGVSAVVHSYLAQSKKTKLSWKSDGPLQLGDEPVVSGAKVLGREKAALWIEMAPSGQARLDWSASVEHPGGVAIELSAQTDEASDSMRSSFTVVPHGAPRFTSVGGAIEGEVFTLPLSVPQRAIPEATQLEISLAPSVAQAVAGSLADLAGYPYGCVEQTMSRFLPDVVVCDAQRKLGVRDPKLEAELPKMVEDGLARLYNFQHEDGGWGWWEEDATNPYMTAYVAYGLTLAKRAGVAVRDPVYEKGLDGLAAIVSESTSDEPENGKKAKQPDSNARAYMLFALSLAGRPDPVALRALFADRDKLDRYGKAVLGRALWAAGEAGRANAVVLARELMADAKLTPSACSWEGRPLGQGWTSGDVEITAQVLHLLAETGEGKDLRDRAASWLVAHRRGSSWYSTKDTAMALYALADHVVRSGELDAEEELSVSIDGRILASKRIDRTNVLTESIHAHFESTDLAGAKTITFRRSGKGRAYYTACLRTISLEEDQTVSPGGLAVERKIELRGRDKDGEPTSTAIGGAPLHVGDLLQVTITASATEPSEYILIEDPISAGCEFVRQDLHGESGEGADETDLEDHREYRDDRFAATASYLEPGRPLVIRYLLRCERPGDFHILPTRAVCMYAPDVGGSGAEARFSIRYAH